MSQIQSRGKYINLHTARTVLPISCTACNVTGGIGERMNRCWKLSAFEPRHDKTNKVTVCPAKTQISLGIRPV